MIFHLTPQTFNDWSERVLTLMSIYLWWWYLFLCLLVYISVLSYSFVCIYWIRYVGTVQYCIKQTECRSSSYGWNLKGNPIWDCIKIWHRFMNTFVSRLSVSFVYLYSRAYWITGFSHQNFEILTESKNLIKSNFVMNISESIVFVISPSLNL